MEPRSRRLSSVSTLHALSEDPVPDALVPPELLDPLVASPVPVVLPELAAPCPAAPVEPPLDDEVPLLPYPEESVPPLAPDPVVSELLLVPVALEDGPAGVLLRDEVPAEEPSAAGLSELIEPLVLVPRSDVAGALSPPCANVAALAPSNEMNSANDSFFILPPNNVSVELPHELLITEVRPHAFRQFDFVCGNPTRQPMATERVSADRTAASSALKIKRLKPCASALNGLICRQAVGKRDLALGSMQAAISRLSQACPDPEFLCLQVLKQKALTCDTSKFLRECPQPA